MRLLAGAVLLCIACGPRMPPIPFDPDAGGNEPAVVQDAGLADGGVNRWAAVEALFTERVTTRDGGSGAMGLVVFDGRGQKVFEKYLGPINGESRIAVASASKLVSAMVLFEVIRRGQLTLDSTTGQVLGWTGPKAAITLRQLLSFTSGLPPNNLCTSNPLTTLAACVNVLSGVTLEAPPGTRYDYGSTHLHVAARMAEVVTGKTWPQLFDEVARQPLGLSSETEYFCAPLQRAGRQNPLVAGGLVITPNEYAKLLLVNAGRGTLGTTVIGAPALYDEQGKEPFPGVTVGVSPVQALGLPFRYGLGAWLECATPGQGCAVISSPGAFGFTPWVDRQAGHAAMLVTQEMRSSAESGVVGFSIDLEQALQPLIRAALSP
ncbi:MAG: serine hydrolase [Myxococcaceae bacterium]|nr:serine hydrolase [Myxococcaceae bacterium]